MQLRVSDTALLDSSRRPVCPCIARVSASQALSESCYQPNACSLHDSIMAFVGEQSLALGELKPPGHCQLTTVDNSRCSTRVVCELHTMCHTVTVWQTVWVEQSSRAVTPCQEWGSSVLSVAH